MREIKFRCWIKPNEEFGELGKMVTMDYSGMPFDEEHECRDTDGNEYLSSEPIWLQYTGLKDKNGVEIYDGDILEASLYKSTRRFVVEWMSIANHSTFGAGTHNVEVIGNIYENSDLLVSTKEGSS